MRLSLVRWMPGCSAVVLLVPAIFAQPCLPTPITPSYIVPSPRANHPFTATVRFAREQKLIDGNTIRGAATLHVARDSAGRTRWESPAGCFVDGGEDTQQVVRTIVYDPITRVVETWWTGGASRKVVNVVRQPPPKPQVKVSVQQLEEQAAVERARKSDHSERLGTRTLAGLLAEGTRIAHTIPARQIGSDFPIVMTEEIWRAKNIDLVLLRTKDDPRSGHVSIEVTELKLGEPDPELFQPSADYQVQEETIRPVESGQKPE